MSFGKVLSFIVAAVVSYWLILIGGSLTYFAAIVLWPIFFVVYF